MHDQKVIYVLSGSINDVTKTIVLGISGHAITRTLPHVWVQREITML